MSMTFHSEAGRNPICRHILVSCWNEHCGAPGMRVLSYDAETGSIRLKSSQFPDLSCNCTAYNASKHILYITNEIHNNPDYARGGGGLIWAFRVNPETGVLTQLSRVESCCPCPSYLTLDQTGKYLLMACHSSFNAVTKAVKGEDGYWHTAVEYDDAIVGLFRLNDDGSIGPLVDVKKHDQYKCPSKTLHAHPHTMTHSPDYSLYACNDKGDSHIYFYRLDYSKEALVLACEPYWDNGGASPRYCAYHPVKPWFFVNHERDMRVTSFHLGKDGALQEINTAKAIPDELEGRSTSAVREAIHGEACDPPEDGFWPLEQQGFVISKDGRFLYDALNGADAVAVFEINQENGTIRRIQICPVDGRWVRGCALSPDGRFLAVSSLQSGGVSIYKIAEDGTLCACVSHVELHGGSYLTFF